MQKWEQPQQSPPYVNCQRFFLFGYIIRKFRCDLLLKTAGIFFTIKKHLARCLLGYSGILRRTDFQMLGWGLMTAASVYYVNALMEPEDAIKGAGLFHNGIYPWKRTWFFSWRNTHRPCRSTRNAALLNSLCIHWCTDRTNLC